MTFKFSFKHSGFNSAC